MVDAVHTTITIRNVPKRTIDKLATKAARSGFCLEDYVRRELIALADRPAIETALDSIRERSETLQSTLSADDIKTGLISDSGHAWDHNAAAWVRIQRRGDSRRSG